MIIKFMARLAKGMDLHINSQDLVETGQPPNMFRREALMASVSKSFGIFVSFLMIVVLILPPILLAADDTTDNKLPRDASPQQKLTAEEKPNPYKDADISIKLISSANKTYGYDILPYGRPLVHQPSIPGLPGNEGFTTKERAQKVAELVVKKIRNNEMPPTVSIEDLNKIGVLKKAQ